MPATTITCADGFELGAYEASPSGAAKGAVVVIQEIFGVNSHIRSVVDGYAEDGFYAIAPAIFDRLERGVELGYTEDDMTAGIELAFQKLDMSQTLADLQTSIHRAAQHGKVGVVGYCFGGLLTWLSSCNLEGVAAASAYYGGGIPDQAELNPGCPLILHFGEQDAHIPMDSVATLQSKQPNLPVHIYAADHGFNCDQRGSYDADAAALAKARTLELFNEQLAG
ncbi:MAG: dienelactone hydrolase family protein [Halieaceae bacterium]